MSDHPDITVAHGAEQLSRLAAARISDRMGSAIEARGVCTVALAGGETPRLVYRVLAAEPFRSAIAWRHVHLFFGDERMVPPLDPSSNYGMVHRELLSRVPVPAEQVHRMRGEIAPPDAAREYEAELEKEFRGHVPRFDLVLLGVGEDGHTASLFPGSDALTEMSRLAVSCFVPQINSWRVTLTLPLLLNAREVLFLAAGKRKASVIARIMAAHVPQLDLPASLVRPSQGTTQWMMDDEAASAF